MTSIFDQYEQAHQKTTSANATDKALQLPTSGFVNVKIEDETPMFTKQKVNFSPTNKVTHLVVGGNTIVLAMANNILLRINLDNPIVLEEVKLSSKLANLFMDPNGNHTLVTFEGNEICHLQPGSTKLKSLSKLKGNYITCIGWTQFGPFMFGTSKGDIMESEVLPDYNPYIKQLFNINKRIFDIHFLHLSMEKESTILVSTVDRVYTFQGFLNKDKPLFSNLFQTYLSRPESFIEEKNLLKFSKLQVLLSKDKSTAKLYAWYLEKGLFIQELDEEASSPSIIEVPSGLISFILTDFHALLLYSDHVTGVSLLNKEVVFEDYYNSTDTHGKLVDIVKDSVKGRIWVIAELAVFRYKIVREDRHVWLIYTQKGDWEKAKSFCQDNPANLDIVVQKQAEALYNDAKYEASSFLWARSHANLEDIALKFLQVWQVESLRTYLKKKLERLGHDDKAQITMIVLWVMELYLYELGELRNSGQESSEQYRTLQVNLEIFLALPQVTEFVKNHKPTVVDLISSHGDKQNLIKLTIATKDYERNIRQLIQEGKYKQSLNQLCQQNNLDLWYLFIPTLLQNAGKQTIDVIITYKIPLDASILLSSLMSCSDETMQIRFLEYCIHSTNCQTQSVHNYLLLLYTKHKPEKLNEYLAIQGHDLTMLNYDVHYALRICREYNRTEACVTLSCVLGLWEAAVDLALTVDVELAKHTAGLPPVTAVDLKRKLWLKIAKHIVLEKNDIKSVIEFLEQTESLSIEDILPFFSDFTCIDQFKQAICTSLDQYNQHILDLKQEMNEATKSAEQIRNDIQNCGNRYYIIENNDMCNICDCQLLNNAFYIFPCGHKFHSRCLVEELDSDKKEQLDKIKMDNLKKKLEDDGSDSSNDNNLDKTEIDNLIAKECFFCGSHMIESIDKPFINYEDIERIAKEWE